MIWTAAPLLVLLAIVIVVLIWAEERLHEREWSVRQLADGTQEARIVVYRGYRPSHIELEADIPATLRFERREDDPCTELLVSELWPNAHRLVAHGETAVRFTPLRPGRFVFTCGMGMYSGELVVHERRTS